MMPPLSLSLPQAGQIRLNALFPRASGPLFWTLLVQIQLTILLSILLSPARLQPLWLPTLWLASLKRLSFPQDIIEAIIFLTDIFTMYLKRGSSIWRKSGSNSTTYILHPRKYLLRAINSPLKILTRKLQDHQYHPSTDLNLNPDLKPEAKLKPQRL